MTPEVHEMADDYYEFDDGDVAPRKRDNLFIWTVFILLLIGVAFACWLGSFYVFGHPEQPRNYRILKKLKKVEAPKRFEETGAPPGDFLRAQQLFERYIGYSRLQLENENAELLRTFVTNYRETKKLVPYLRGNFTIASATPLTSKDFIPNGMVALGQSNEFPQVLIEHLYPMSEENIGKSRRLLVTGNPIKLEKSYDLGAVIHVEKLSESRLQFTVVPLLYGGYELRGVGRFSTEPPKDINLESGLPVMKSAPVAEALKLFAEFRRNQPDAEPVVQGETPGLAKAPEIVRFDAVPEGVKIPTTGPLPEVPVATPVPLTARNAPPPRKAPAELLTMLNATPRPIAVATPLPAGTKPLIAAPTPAAGAIATPAPNLPAGVVKPFIASNPRPGLPSAQGNNWRTYKPGNMPTGRALEPAEASALAEGGAVGERNYLRGDFVVTASGPTSAVLRPRLANGDADAAVRVIVEYPNGAVPPPEGGALDRDDTRPYEIREVGRDAKGNINIFVREIIQQ